jgi:hypothetical protein
MQLLNITKITEGYYSVESLLCRYCNTSITQVITGPQLWAYNNNAHIQEVFPDMESVVRERFITGTCDDCWKKIFSPDEEEED